RFGERQRIVAINHARVVHEDVDATGELERSAHDVRCLAAVLQVGGYAVEASSGAFDFTPGRRRIRTTDCDDVRTRSGERACDALAEAGVRARDESDFSREREQIQVRHGHHFSWQMSRTFMSV